MSRKQPLSLTNLEGGEVMEDITKAMTEIQDAVLGKKTKGSLTIKITFDSTKQDSICAVTAELTKAVPKAKRSSLYNRGSHYLVADPVPEKRGNQEEIDEVTKVVDLNRKQA